MSEVSPSKLSVFERFVPILILISVVLAFMVGVLWQKVNTLEKGDTTTTTTAGAPVAPVAPTITMDQIKGVFSKNVIKIGDENRKLLIVEVADPSCPWCHVAGGKDKELYS